MIKPTLVFFGSFQHYSAKILEGLIASHLFDILAVVTTPDNPVQILAQKHSLPILTPEKLDEETLKSLYTVYGIQYTDLFVTAGYGKLLPKSWLTFPKIAALNLHFSLLPAYRGANPAEWAILMNEKETGVSLIEMSEKFDSGNIIAQQSIAITPEETRETLYHKLYTLGAQELPIMLSNYINHPTSTPQSLARNEVRARRLSRNDGFIEWITIKKTLQGDTLKVEDLSPLLQEIAGHEPRATSYELIERATRAFAGYPGLWTIVPTKKGDKRMKLLPGNLVQIEGYQPSRYNQIKNLIT